MQARLWVLSAVCVPMLCGLVASAPAQPVPKPAPAPATTTQNFEFRACNNYKTHIFVALSHRVSFGSKEWRTHGWYRLEPGCHDLGVVPRPWLYLYADAPDGAYWAGKGNATICIPSAAFNRISTGAYSCTPSEQLRVFIEDQIDDKTGRYTANFD